MIKEQLRDTKDFNTLTRDVLRVEARRHSIRIASRYDTYRTPSEATKEELVRSFSRARDEGKFGAVKSTTGTDSPNVTIKTRSVAAFLKGKGCGNQDTWVAATVEDGKIVIYPEVAPQDYESEDMDDYEKFVTTAADLRALLKALGV